MRVWARLPRPLEAVRESDAILREEFAKAVGQKPVFHGVPDFKSVGVEQRAHFDYMVIMRAVNTVDAMTLPRRIAWDVLHKITDRILKEVKRKPRLYDLLPNPLRRLSWNKTKYRKNPVFMRVCGVYRSLLITI